jgi:hypothetical protein
MSISNLAFGGPIMADNPMNERVEEHNPGDRRNTSELPTSADVTGNKENAKPEIRSDNDSNAGMRGDDFLEPQDG